MTRQCKCGRPVTAGHTAGGTGTERCLICVTAEVMRTFRDPMTAKYRARDKKKRVPSTSAVEETQA